jgi:hypothetical protein
MIKKLAGVLVAAAAMLAVTAGAASAATPGNAGLQQRVDAVLTAIPGGTQVSATEVRYDGLTVTLDSAASKDARLFAGCQYGHLCFRVNGTNFDFYTCTTWDLSNWVGEATYSNNQTPGTTARAYDAAWVERWTSTAFDTGIVNVGPWYHLKVC